MREKNVNSASNTQMDVNIRLLGRIAVEIQGQEVAVKGVKPQALLIWLALHLGRPSGRDQVSRLLWPNAGQDNARVSLRQALAVLRKVLPPDALIADNQGLALNETLCHVDAIAFQQSLRDGPNQDLAHAVNLYQGELCNGFLSQVDGFDDWLSLERQALRRHAQRALQTRLQQQTDQHELSPAIDTAEKLLSLDPLQEKVHRQLMTLHAQLGETGSAIRQFDLCKEALARELGAPPAPETVALLNAIRKGEITRSAKPESQPAQATDTAIPAAQNADAASQEDRRPRLPALAVLPFVSMSSDTEHEFLADGMTEELINLLAQSVSWRVMSRNSSFLYKGKNVDVREVGEALGVGYVVEGSIRRVGERIRVTAQLVNTLDGTQIWSDRYDNPVAEIFDVQDEVVHAIFRVLKNRLGFAERERVRRTQKANLDAWGLLIKANQVAVRDKASREEQRGLVHDALAIDPDYARAHAYLASILFVAVARGYTSDSKGDYKAGMAHVEKALASGETDPVVLRMCAGGLAAVGKGERAMRLSQRAYEITSTVTPLYVAVLMWNGRLAEAKAHCEGLVASLPTGIASAPGELRPVAILGNLLMLEEDYEGALPYAERDLNENPGNYFSYVNLANVLGYLGRAEEARVKWQQAVELMPALTLGLFRLGYSSVFVDQALADKFSAGLVLAEVE